MRLGKGTSQHVLISGKTGSGKSTLLNAMITNLALCYSPDELEFEHGDPTHGSAELAHAVSSETAKRLEALPLASTRPRVHPTRIRHRQS